MITFSSELQSRLEELRKELINPCVYDIAVFRCFKDKDINIRQYLGRVEANKKIMIGAVMSRFEDRLIEQIVKGSGIYEKVPQLNFVIEDDISVDAKFRKRSLGRLFTEHNSYTGKWHDVKNNQNEGTALVLLWTGTLELDISHAQIIAEL